MIRFLIRLGVLQLGLACVAGFPALATEHEQWRGLTVAPENRCSDYDSDDYRYPQSVELEIIAAMDGRIYGPYSGRTFGSRKETDIEHIVARSEAHDSGLCDRSPEARKAFARDLLNLTLAAPRLNRYEKVAKDAAEWLPDHNRCWYVARIVEVKRKYGLTVNQMEAAAIDDVLEGCNSTEIQFVDAESAR